MHDWTLLDVRLDWAACLAEVRMLDDHSLPRCIVFTGLKEVSVDRRDHWGPSSSINAVSWQGGEACKGVSIRIEMQTGGVISISAAACEIDGLHHSSILKDD